MVCRVTLFVMVSVLATLPVVGAAQDPPAGQNSPKEKKPGANVTASMTGCVDEQDGRYVLIHDQSRDLIATLEAEGFPTENFAKHLGHKVTVRGTSNPNGAHPVFKVRSVETISESCGAQH